MSGVYIKSMKMPESCTFCELYDYDNYWCHLERRDVEPCYQDKPSSFCPLIPVPDHGRLVDADALVKENAMAWGTDDIIRIAKAPTIVPADKEGEK